jgi:hypothetical protein
VSQTAQILLYAFVAGLSPLALLSTVAVLGSGHGRIRGTAFCVGFLLTQTLVMALALLVGAAAVPDRDREHQTLAAVLGLLLGMALLGLAYRGSRPSGPLEDADESRAKAFLNRLGRVHTATAFSFGALLGVGGVKRLTITVIAGATIAIGGFDRGEEAALAVVYVVIASALVWLPVAVYLVAGSRADGWTASTQAWLLANQQRATVVSTLVFGLLVIGHSLLLLL